MSKTVSLANNLIIKIVALGILVLVVYSNSLNNPFQFDDWHVVSQNPAVRGPANIPSFFADPATFSILIGNRDYRPVFLTSMALSWWAGNGATLPFHLVSVFLHMSNVLLLFVIFRLCLPKNENSIRDFSSSERDWAAFLSASLFAVHPLASDSVNYISAQSVLLAAFFYLLSFYLFLKVYAQQRSCRPSTRWILISVSVVSYFLALLSKPVAITFPIILLLWELLLNRRPSSKEHRNVNPWMRYAYPLRKHLPYFGISAIYLLIRRTIFENPFGATEPIRPILTHYLTQTKAIVFYYLKLSVLPFGLNADIEYPLSSSFFEGKVILALLILAGVIWLLFRFRRKKFLVFWALWFPVCLLVTTYVVILGQVVNEHRVYLSLVGFCAVAGFLLLTLGRAFPLSISDLSIGSRAGRILVTTASLVLLVVFASGTRGRNQVWASDLALWEDAALHGGTWRAHMNYGLALEDEGRAEEALSQFKEAVELGAYAWAHLNLGHAYVRRRDYKQGLEHLRQAVSLWPSLPEAHLYLGYGLQSAGEIEEAKKEMQTAIGFRSNYLKAHEFLAQLYQEQGEIDSALVVYERLLELDPGQSRIRDIVEGLTSGETSLSFLIDLANQNIQAGKHEKALSQLEKGYLQQPQNPDILFNLGFAHQKLGNTVMAIRFYKELLQVSPTHRQGTFNLAYEYKQGNSAEDWSRSALFFQKALEIAPDYHEILHHLATVYWKLENKDEATKYDRLFLQNGKHLNLLNTSEARLKAANAASPPAQN